VLLSAHRIAVSMGEMNAFRDANVSIAEWAVLRTIGNRQNVSLKEIGVASGVSRQRIRKVLSDLQSKGLIALGKSEGSDRRGRAVSATAATAGVLAAVSQQMQVLVPEGQGRQSRRLAVAARTLDKLGKQVRRGLVPAKAARRKKTDNAPELDED
jgi:DNA-binding MarR family transcriptional regulator